MKYLLPLFLLLFIFPDHVFSQEVIRLDKSKATVDPSIPDATFNLLFQTLEKAVQDYARFATLYDDADKSVTSISLNNYISLFDASIARMPKDYLYDSTVIQADINDYFLGVMESPLNKSGIEVNVSNPVLLQVYTDKISPEHIISKLLVRKTFQNYLDGSEAGYYKTPVTRNILLTYRTPVYYLSEALITSVEYYLPQNVPAITKTEPITVIPGKPSVSAKPVNPCTLYDAGSKLPQSINEDTLVLIEKVICEALEQYKKNATLFDSTAGSVTSSSASRFQQLFSSGSSLHLSDFREYPDNIEVSNYREDVFKFFRNTGISFKLNNPRIAEINYDPDGFYYVKLFITKELLVYLDDESYEIERPGKPRKFNLEMDYIIPERNMNNPLIEKAISTAILKPEEKRTILFFGPNLTFGLASANAVSGYNSITDKTTLNSTFGPGFQLDLISNFWAKHRAQKKSLFLAVGVGFQSFTVEAEAKGLRSDIEITTIDNETGLLRREISILKDRIPMRILNIPVGIEYRIISTANQKFEMFFGGKIVPSYLLSSQTKFDVEGFYNLTYEQYGFSFFNEGRAFQLNPDFKNNAEMLYGIGEFNLNDNKGTKLDSRFLLGYKLDASTVFRISANFMINARASFGAFFGEMITPSDSPAQFPIDSNRKPLENQIIIRETLIQDYFREFKVNPVSIMIGFGYKLSN